MTDQNGEQQSQEEEGEGEKKPIMIQSVRLRMAVYEQELKKTAQKEFEKKEVIPDDLDHVSKQVYTAPLNERVGRRQSVAGPLSASIRKIEPMKTDYVKAIEASNQSSPVKRRHTMSSAPAPAPTRIFKAPPRKMQEKEDPSENSSSHGAAPFDITSTRPGITRGGSFNDDDEFWNIPQEILDEEEKNAKSELSRLLEEEGVDHDGTDLDFRSVRDRYMSAINTLRPNRDEIDVGKIGIDEKQPEEKKDLISNVRKSFRMEAVKKERLVDIQDAWDDYEVKAQDAPDEEAPGEKEAAGKLITVEDEVVEDWVGYAQEMEKSFGSMHDDDESEVSDDEEMKMWILEAKQLRAEAIARRQKKENALTRKQERLQRRAERAARNDLASLLAEDGLDCDPSEVSFSSLRTRYVAAVDHHRPIKRNPFEFGIDDASPEQLAALRLDAKENLIDESIKRRRLITIQSAWDKYEGKARDRPKIWSATEKEAQHKVRHVEDEVEKEWATYRANVEEGIAAVKKAPGHTESAEQDEEEEELEQLISEAKQAEEEAEARRKLKDEEMKERQAKHDVAEIETRNALSKLLDEEGVEAGDAEVNFGSVRGRYMTALNKVRPARKEPSLGLIVAESTDEDIASIRNQRSDYFKAETAKMNRFALIQDAWDKYEDFAQDRPLEPSAEEKESAEKVEKLEDDVVNDWVDYSGKVAGDIKNADESEIEKAHNIDNKEEMQEWINRTKDMKEQAAARRKAKHKRAKKARADERKKKKEKRQENGEEGDDEDEDSKAEKKARRKSKVDKSEYGDGGDDYHDDDNEGEAEAEAEDDGEEEEDGEDDDDGEGSSSKKKKRRKKTKSKAGQTDADDGEEEDDGEGDAEGDGEADDNEGETEGQASKRKKKKKKKTKEDEDDDDGEITDSPRKKKKKGKDKGKKNDDDDDDEDEDDEGQLTESPTKKKKKKGKRRSSILGENNGENDDDEDDDGEQTATEATKKKKKKNRRSSIGMDDDDDDDGNRTDASKKKKEKEKKKSRRKSEMGATSAPADEEHEDDENEETDASGKKKEKSKSKKSSKKDEDAESPKSPSKRRRSTLKRSSSAKLEGEVSLGDTPPPRNADGSLWINPLKGWYNPPKTKTKFVGASITMTVPEKTDCWRKTRHNFILVNSPFHWHKVTGDFEVLACISGDLRTMYDKAGLMIRQDDENWIFSGMECFNGRMNHATSVTKDFTDWSLSPLPGNSELVGIWFCLKRLGNAYESYFSLDAKQWIQTRQGVFTEEPTLLVGITAACPQGQEFKATFDFYRCRLL